MTFPELDILAPKDSSIENWDDWPTYSLRRTNIISQETGKSISLLQAHKNHAVRITGYLETIDSGQAHCVRDQKYRNKAIEIVDVVAYAFAEFHDGSFGFWAAGKAGWFEIKEPVAACQLSYNMMKEAASMFYLLADKLRNSRFLHERLSYKQMDNYAMKTFRKYLNCEKNYLRRTNEDEVREGFHAHSDFLIASMLEGQEGLDWPRSPMYTYFKRTFPERFNDILARLSPEQVPETKPKPSDTKEMPTKKVTAKSGDKRKREPDRQPTVSVQADNGSNEGTDTSSDADDNVAKPPVKSQKRKSILQPAGSKYSRKAAGRRRSLPQVDPEANKRDFEEDESVDESEPADEEEVKSTRSSADPKKTTSLRRSLRRSGTPSKQASAAPYHDYLPRKYVEVKVVEYDIPIPTCLPDDGPGDVWTCPFDPCKHKVWEASSTAGNASIKEHYQEHIRDAQAKIDLAYNESRPYLPVGNLVRHLESRIPPLDLHPDSQPPAGRPLRIISRY